MKQVVGSLLVAVLMACAPATKEGAIGTPASRSPKPMDELIQQLAAPDATSRAAAAWSIAGVRRAGAPVVQALRVALEDPSESVREAATWALAHIVAPNWHAKSLWSTNPKLLVQTRAVYPQAAYVEKVQGTVLVTFLINESGRVSHAEIKESIAGLDAAALACVRSWQFQPARRDGKPVCSVAHAPVTFRIY